jgi:murein DD-endopeptidase MepM/ murein hydrolase activator NlpD
MRVDAALRAIVAALFAFVATAVRGAVPGGIAVLDVPPDARATFDGKPVFTVATPKPVAIVGIGLDEKVGRKLLVVDSAQGHAEIPFDVTAKAYPEQRLTLPPDKVNPPPEVMPRIERETKLTQEQFARYSDLTASPFPLLQPATGRISSNFGMRRILNGEPKSPHAGLDFAAPLGAPVKAPAAGRVTLVGDFYFTGNVVFVDHGGGMVSMMCHLSAVDVHEGDVVARGQLLGRVGATGRATGPHLHWAVSLNDERVDPSMLLKLYRPKKAAPDAPKQASDISVSTKPGAPPAAH